MRQGIMLLMALSAGIALGGEGTVKKLPKVAMEGGKPLMEVLKLRRSSRDFVKGARLSDQELGEVLWAANGFNRESRRTSPSALNSQAVDTYVFDASGVWYYDGREHSLQLIKSGDFRGDTGVQDFVADASVNLVFVYDLDRAPSKGSDRWAEIDCTFPSENVYLYCASKGLKTVVRGSFDGLKIASHLGLRSSQRVILTQSVGK